MNDCAGERSTLHGAYPMREITIFREIVYNCRMTENKNNDSNRALRNRLGTRVIPEGELVAETMKRVVELFQKKYQGTLVSEASDITEEDADRVQAFLIDAFPPDGENYRTHGHLQLTGEFAAKIAERIGLKSHEFRVLGLLHDLGRLLTHPFGVNPHRYYRNDLLGDVLMRKIGITPAMRDKLQPHASYCNPSDFSSLENFSLAQKIVMIADILGKRKDDGSIQSFEQTLQYHKDSREAFSKENPNEDKGPWPSENTAKQITTPEVVDQWGRLYRALAEWLQSKYCIDIEELRNAIETTEKDMPIDTLIFDVGGVLIPDSDPEILDDFCRELLLEKEKLQNHLNALAPQLQMGAIGIDEFWTQFEQLIEKPISPELRDALFVRNFKATIDPQMKQILEWLKFAGYRLCVLSDTIPPHADALRRAGTYDLFSPNIFLSHEIRCSKHSGSIFQKNSDLAAFCVACLRMRRLPKACMFFDDKKKNVKAAMRASMHADCVQNAADLERALAYAGIPYPLQ